jgi:hypothetical protein
MAICETCGAKYRPTPEAPECPACAAGTEPAPAPRPAAAPRPAGAAPRPAAAARPAAAPAPRAAASAAPAAPRARPAAPPPPPPAPVVRHAAHGHAAHGQPHAMRLDKNTKIGFAIVGGLAVVTLIVVLTIKGKKSDERRVEQDQAQAVATLMASIRSLTGDLNEKNSRDVIDLVKSKKDVLKWANNDDRREADQAVNRATSAIENAKQRDELLGRWDVLQKKMASPSLSDEEIKDCQRELNEIDVQKSILGGEKEKQVTETMKTAAHLFAQKAFDNAKTVADANKDNPRNAMRKAALAEDQIADQVNKWYRQKQSKDPAAETELAFYEPLYKQAIELSDSLANAMVGARSATEVMDPPFKDMLGPEQAKNWNPTNAKGFSWKIDAGTLNIIGPDEGEKQQAILAIGDREQWRNFMLEFEVTIDKGTCDLYFRLGKNPNSNTPSYHLTTQGDKSPLPAGQATKLRVAIVGSKRQIRLMGDAGGEIVNDELPWTKTRKGAIGIVIPPGARLKFTEFKVYAIE